MQNIFHFGTGVTSRQNFPDIYVHNISSIYLTINYPNIIISISVVCIHLYKIINKQIMPEGVILGLTNAFLTYRDLMRAEGPKHIPIF